MALRSHNLFYLMMAALWFTAMWKGAREEMQGSTVFLNAYCSCSGGTRSELTSPHSIIFPFGGQYYISRMSKLILFKKSLQRSVICASNYSIFLKFSFLLLPLISSLILPGEKAVTQARGCWACPRLSCSSECLCESVAGSWLPGRQSTPRKAVNKVRRSFRNDPHQF